MDHLKETLVNIYEKFDENILMWEFSWRSKRIIRSSQSAKKHKTTTKKKKQNYDVN